MLDFGWAELLILVAVAVFVIGPKDIPNIMYGLGRVIRRVQYIRFAVSQQFEDIMNSGDIEELRKGVNFEAKRNEQAVLDEAEFDEDIVEDKQNKSKQGTDVQQEEGDDDKPAA